MTEFDELKPKISEYGGHPHRFGPGQVDRLRSEYPDLPQDYFAFLEEFGYGCTGACYVYSGPIWACDMPDYDAELGHVLLVGDNGAGESLGYDTRDDYRSVQIESDGETIPLEEKSVLDYVLAYLD